MGIVKEAIELSCNLSKVLLKSDRAGSLAGINQYISWQHGSRLPITPLKKIIGEQGNHEVVTTLSNHPFELPLTEKATIASIIKHTSPKLLFEFGTYTGATSVAIAKAAGRDATLHTIDLPEEEIIWGEEVKKAIGKRLNERKPEDASIIQHRKNMRAFDFGQFKGLVDFIYIDASHEYEDVILDSQAALNIAHKGSIIVWDDYQSSIPGVVNALNFLGRTLPIYNIELTRLAVLEVQ